MRSLFHLFLLLLPLAAAAQSLPPCPPDADAYWYNCFGTLTFASGEKYVGKFKDNKYNGQGTITFPSGQKYVGEFNDNKRNGQGTITYPSGEKYVGEFKDDKLNGQGTLLRPTGGVIYSGRWVNDKPAP